MEWLCFHAALPFDIPYFRLRCEKWQYEGNGIHVPQLECRMTYQGLLQGKD